MWFPHPLSHRGSSSISIHPFSRLFSIHLLYVSSALQRKADIWQNLQGSGGNSKPPVALLLGMFRQRISDFPLFRNKRDKKKLLNHNRIDLVWKKMLKFRWWRRQFFFYFDLCRCLNCAYVAIEKNFFFYWRPHGHENINALSSLAVEQVNLL